MSTPDTIGKNTGSHWFFQRKKENNEDKLPAKKADMVGYFICQNLLRKKFDGFNQVFSCCNCRGSKRRSNSFLRNVV
jgi:hypothetical protein